MLGKPLQSRFSRKIQLKLKFQAFFYLTGLYEVNGSEYVCGIIGIQKFQYELS